MKSFIALLRQRILVPPFLIIAFLIIFTIWLIDTPPGLLGKADAVGYAVCHRITLRTYFIGDRPMPLCARCTGMHLGTFFGLLFLTRRGKRGDLPAKRLPGRICPVFTGFWAGRHQFLFKPDQPLPYSLYHSKLDPPGTTGTLCWEPGLPVVVYPHL